MVHFGPKALRRRLRRKATMVADPLIDARIIANFACGRNGEHKGFASVRISIKYSIAGDTPCELWKILRKRVPERP